MTIALQRIHMVTTIARFAISSLVGKHIDISYAYKRFKLGALGTIFRGYLSSGMEIFAFSSGKTAR